MKVPYNQIVKILLIICLVVTPLMAVSAQENASQEALIQEIYDNLYQHHVSNPTRDQLTNGAIQGLIQSLDDPYTTYLTEKEYSQFINSIDGSFTGIGVYIELTSDGIVVQGLIPGGPAEKIDIQPGDIITHVNGAKLEGNSIEEATTLILGKAGTNVEVTVYRKGIEGNESINKTMTRQKLTLPHVDQMMLEDNVGYLKLYRFGSDSYNLVKTGLQELEEEGMESLILDLRGNPGGLLYTAMEIGRLFVESGVVLHARDNTGRLTPYSIQDGKDFTKPLVILMDESSASASEILAGFLQESMEATVLGQTSFGKGTVQRLMDLENGGVLKVTIEEYFTPSKKQVNGIGIKPDIQVSNSEMQLAKGYGVLTAKNELWITPEGEILFNGLENSGNGTKIIVKNGKKYMSTRLLSEWYNGKVGWDRATQSIQLTFFEQTVAIKKNDSTIYVEAGISYILLDEIDKKFPFEFKKIGTNDILIKK